MAFFKCNRIFTDNMVLQRNKKNTIWGSGENEKTIQIFFLDREYRTTVENGRWAVQIETESAGGPHILKAICEGHEIILRNILVGDVYLAGGQSNMEWTLQDSSDYEPETFEWIRHYQTPKIEYHEEGKDDSGYQTGWKICTPQEAKSFTAVGYHFAKVLHRTQQIPIGIINCSWGGTSAACWLDRKYLDRDGLSEYKNDFLLVEQRSDEQYKQELAAYQKQIEEVMAQREAYLQENPTATNAFLDTNIAAYPWPPPYGKKSFLRPCGLYETMLTTIVPYGVNGFIWYQGETDTNRPDAYLQLFSCVVENWRHLWKEELPFLFVQLAMYGNGNRDGLEYALLREQQSRAAREIPNTGIAIITDVGDEMDIHPTRKKPVGERLALLALRSIYGENVLCFSPCYQKATQKDNVVYVTFDNVGEGLVCSENQINGFRLSEDGETYVAAAAEIVAHDTVKVWTDLLSNPVGLSYGFANYIECNLYNSSNLPAEPFRIKEM